MEANQEHKELQGVKLNTPEAKAYADIISIQQDLQFSFDCSRILARMLRDGDETPIIKKSLWTSALIAYARCFATGKRMGLNEDYLLKLKGEPVEVHRYYLDLRNRHTAHSVNAFEQIIAGVVLPPPDAENKEILGTTWGSVTLDTPSLEGVEDLIQLTRALKLEVEKLANDAEAKLLEATKKIPIEELYKNPPMRIQIPGPEEVSKTR